MAADLFHCTFCNKTDGKLLLFTKHTLQRCQAILKQRIIYNFKYKDVVLPDLLFERGYHSRCYSKFTSLQKKYNSDNSDEVEKLALSGNEHLSVNYENKAELHMEQSLLEAKIEISQNENIISGTGGDISVNSIDDDDELDIKDVSITSTSSQAPLSTIGETYPAYDTTNINGLCGDDVDFDKKDDRVIMSQSFYCTFCNKNDEKVMKFTENTLKKSRVVLKQRKFHNLKYKDVVLPDSLIEKGYHQHCYKYFTPLQKRYRSNELEKITRQEHLSINNANKKLIITKAALLMEQSVLEAKMKIFQNDNNMTATAGDTYLNGMNDDDKLHMKDVCTASSQATLSTVRDPSPAYTSNPAHTLTSAVANEDNFNAIGDNYIDNFEIKDASIITETNRATSAVDNPPVACISSSTASILIRPIVVPKVKLELPELASPNSEEHWMKLEFGDDTPSHSNLSFKSNVSIDDNEKKCIFCNRKYIKRKSKKMSVRSSDKNFFLSKLDVEDETFTDLIKKVTDYTSIRINYHRHCQSKYFYKISLKNKTEKIGSYHSRQQLHQTVFDDIIIFIEENVVRKGRFLLLTHLREYYIDILKEKQDNTDESIYNDINGQYLETKIIKYFKNKVKFIKIQRSKLIIPKYLTIVQLFVNVSGGDSIHETEIIIPSYTPASAAGDVNDVDPLQFT